MHNTNETENASFRSNVYALLALAFSPPKTDTEKLYNAISDANASLHSPKTQPLETRDSTPSSFSNLASEYLRLFVGPGHVPCPPYESVHRKDRPKFERGLVMGPSTSDVRRMYASAGVEMSKKFNDLPDHVAVEMEFMHYLCNEELDLLEKKNTQRVKAMREMQRKFSEEHIKPWVETFADCVTKASTSLFYREAAKLLKTFTAEDLDYMMGDSE